MIVKKFGGTSVKTDETRSMVAENILHDVRSGHQVVVVISAMGRRGDPYATDTILDMIKQENPNCSARDLDQAFVCGEILSGALMAAKLQKLGYPATVVTGGRTGILTDNQHQHANILSVEPEFLVELLEQNVIPIVCGGQGATVEGDMTILGRGGSDTTATAIGAALGAEIVEIYSDVIGIMTADPREVPNAVIIPAISQEICQEMALAGAKIIHPRAVQMAKNRANMPVYIKSTFVNHPGTMISPEVLEPAGRVIAVAVDHGHDIIAMDVPSQLPGLEEIEPGVYAIKQEWQSDVYPKLREMKYSKQTNLTKLSLIGRKLSEMDRQKLLKLMADNGVVVVADCLSDLSISVWYDSQNNNKSLQALAHNAYI